jgi:hypothetical protein
MDKPEFDHYRQNAPEYTEQILWHRIVATVAVAIAVVALSAWGAYQLLQSSDEESNAVPAIAKTEEAPPTGDAIQLASSAESKARPETKAPPPAESRSVDSAPSVAAPTPIAAQSTDNATAPALTGTVAEAKAAAPEFTVNTQILSKDITRADLANVIVDLEPKEVLQSTAELTEPFVKLYFFTDLDNRAGDRITYIWSLNGKEAARIRVPVGSDRWRSHSSKNINKNMRGEWKVVVTDQQGDTLASSEFVMPEVAATNP